MKDPPLHNKPQHTHHSLNPHTLEHNPKDLIETLHCSNPSQPRRDILKSVTAIIRKGEKFYIGECLEIDVITQGKTIDETLKNLKEAVALYFEDVKIEDVILPDESPLMVSLGVDEYVTG